MNALVTTHGRLIVDNMEFRWLPGAPHVFSVARIAQAVNTGAIAATVMSLTQQDVDEAAKLGHHYDVKEYAHRLAPFTASVPLLAYRCARAGKLVLVDGRQRAARAFMTRDKVEAYVVNETDAELVGRHPASAEAVQLVRFIKDPALLDEIKMALRAIGIDAMFYPRLDLVRAHALATNNNQLLVELDRFAGSCQSYAEGYKLLQSTAHHPVIFDRDASADRASSRHTNQLSHTAATGRPRDGWREDQVKLYYGYFALRLLAIEDAIRLQSSVPRSAPGNNPELTIADYSRGRGALHLRRRSSYNAYLLAHWCDMGLMGPHSWAGFKILARQTRDLYPRFAAIEDNAARIVSKASTYADADAMRDNIAQEIARLIEARDDAGLLRLRDRAIEQFRLLAKAFVRMRQWRPAKEQLLEMERRRTTPSPSQVTRVARWDLDARATLVGLDDMIAFSELTGVVATDIWPLHLDYNTLFECYALLHGVQHRNLRLSVTAAEAFLYRGWLRADGVADDLSPRWEKLFEKFRCFPGTTKMLLGHALHHISTVQGLDLFDRHDMPNAHDFMKQHLSYFESRLGRA